MSTIKDAEGPYVVWQNNGCEGWQPTSYEDLKSAITSQKFSYEWVITKPVSFEIVES